MKVLVIGGGAREHTLVRQYEKSDKVKQIHVAPGNGLMDFRPEKEVIRYPDIKASEVDKLLELVRTLKPDLVDIGPEAPLAAGLVNKLQEIGIPTLGPTKEAAILETSKCWARDFMDKYGIPHPRYKNCRSEQEGVGYVRSLSSNWRGYVKADGLCEGKGSLRADNVEEALGNIELMKKFGDAGKSFVVEDFICGDDGTNEEFSAYAFCDGKTYKMLRRFAQDNKRELNFDEGDQTGGMGANAPALVVTEDADLVEQVENIFKKAVYGMQVEGIPYKGVLYIGGMRVRKNGKNIAVVGEFNVRRGDPEEQVTGTGVKTDPVDIAFAVIEGKLDDIKIEEDEIVRVCIVGASRGYPRDYSAVRGKQIFGLEEAMKVPRVTIYGAGVRKEGNKFYADGGRLFSVVAEGKDVIEARPRALYAMSMINIEGNNLHYRTDIGWRDVERLLRG